MARQPELIGRKKRRMILRYDQGSSGQLLETRVDLTLENIETNVVPTPVSPLYQLRLVPFFSVPARPNDLELRRLTLCITEGGTRTAYIPYLPTDSNHNDMIREYLALLEDETFNGIQYKAEDFVA